MIYAMAHLSALRICVSPPLSPSTLCMAYRFPLLIWTSYAQVARQLKAELVAVPHWFSVSTRSGELEISLDADSCFNAEVCTLPPLAPRARHQFPLSESSCGRQVYVADIRLEDSDLRVNIGERLLATLFSRRVRAAHMIRLTPRSSFLPLLSSLCPVLPSPSLPIPS